MKSSFRVRASNSTPSDAVELTCRIPEFAAQAVQNPLDASGWANLGVALRCAGQLDTAIALNRRALSIDPDSPAVLSNLGGLLRAAGELEEAARLLQRGVALSPEMSAAHFNLGLALEDAGRCAEALSCYDKSIELEPGRKDALGQRAFTLLRMGDFKEGLLAYEKRLQFEPMLQRGFAQPTWDGANFAGRTLLLYSEQGRGDTLQFIRYAGMAKARGGTVIVECPTDLCGLVERVDGVDRVFIQGKSLPNFDLHASLMSLPYIFGTTINTIPNSIPYLSVPPQARGTVTVDSSKLLKVGIVWGTGHENVGAHERSASLRNLLKLLEIPQVALYSLQVGPSASEISQLGCEHVIPDLGSQFADFAHTADAIAHMDLVITVDTAVLHLAAALGKPVWVLLPFTAEWRWLQERSDTPWYPTARLYRQKRPFDWDDTLERVKADLSNYCRQQPMSSL